MSNPRSPADEIIDEQTSAVLRRLGYMVLWGPPAALVVEPPRWPGGAVICGRERPPWWRPFARRRWDRTVVLAWRQHAAMVAHGLDFGARR